MPQCFYPFRKKDGDVVACGKCVNCRKRLISAWSFRLMQEFKVSDSAHFITLTYDSINIPITKKGFMSLSVRDCQLFFKKLRKAHVQSSLSHLSEKSIKYYLAGEYGGRTNRPHYHIILFNANIRFIERAWGKGHVNYGDPSKGVTEASIGYCLKYISKKTFVLKHCNDDRCKEFGLQSKGLGASYLTKSMIHWHKQDLENRMYVNIAGGKKATMARYYKDKLYSEPERLLISRDLSEKMFMKNLHPIEDWGNIEASKKAALRAVIKNQNKKL